MSFCKFWADLCVLGVYFFFQEVVRDACVVRNPGGVCPVQSFGWREAQQSRGIYVQTLCVGSICFLGKVKECMSKIEFWKLRVVIGIQVMENFPWENNYIVCVGLS